MFGCVLSVEVRSVSRCAVERNCVRQRMNAGELRGKSDSISNGFHFSRLLWGLNARTCTYMYQ